jgi:hypothetical protein
MLEVLFAQLTCGQQFACNAYDAAVKIAYAVIVTAVIVVVLAFVRKKRSDAALK